MWAVILITLAVLGGAGSAYYYNADDKPIEEMSEYVIEYQLGLPSGIIDLTPSSPEK